MGLIEHGFRIEVAQAVTFGGPPGTMVKASVYKHGWSQRTGEALKGKHVGVALVEGPREGATVDELIPPLLINLGRLWRAAGGMENVSLDGHYDSMEPLEAAVFELVGEASSEDISQEWREKLCGLLPGGHAYKRIPKSDQASRCERCERVSGK